MRFGRDRHPFVGREPPVHIAKLLHVMQVLLAGEQGAGADVNICSRWQAHLAGQPCHQLLHHPVRHAMALARIDVAKQREMRKQHTPVAAEPPQQASPIELVGVGP